jgi:hypothetical protein
VNIDHYEAVGILKAAGSVIALRVERDEYPEGILGESYESEPPSISKILPPPLQTSTNSNSPQNNQDQVQISQELGQNPTHLEIPHTNGLKQVSILVQKQGN